VAELRYEWYRRLEPAAPGRDLARGFRAEVADPLWLLARQWQLGEHQGEDASTPVLVQMRVSYDPIQPQEDDPLAREPTQVPPEAIVEGEPGSWWTLGRRIRLGRAVRGDLPDPIPDRFLFGELAPPYDRFRGDVDGRAVRADPAFADNAAFDEVPDEPPDRWLPDRLAHYASFPAGGGTLHVGGHDGGDVDWYSADAENVTPSPPRTTHVLPSRLHYPGAPLPRWWQIEDRHVDVGGFPPDRSHLSTLLLIDLVVAHSDDWFTFPLKPDPAQPSSGTVVTLQFVDVKDDFDEWWTLAVPTGEGDPPEQPPPGLRAEPWSVFRMKGLDRRGLVVWPTVATPLGGPLLDDVALGVDEDANLLWAVELRADGEPLLANAENPVALQETTPSGTRRFTYLPSSTLPPHWHPYRIEGSPRRFRQGLVADLTKDPIEPRDGPSSSLLTGGPATGHELAPVAVPNQGLRLERRHVLGRATDGAPVLWIQRRRVPLLGGPVSHLRFDVLAEAPPVH
jgi:hypothetical protein